MDNPHFKYRLEARNPSGDVTYVLLKVQEIKTFPRNFEEYDAIEAATEILGKDGYDVEWREASSVCGLWVPRLR